MMMMILGRISVKFISIRYVMSGDFCPSASTSAQSLALCLVWVGLVHASISQLHYSRIVLQLYFVISSTVFCPNVFLGYMAVADLQSNTTVFRDFFNCTVCKICSANVFLSHTAVDGQQKCSQPRFMCLMWVGLVH